MNALLIAAFVAAALAWLTSSLLTIVNYAFRYPAYDQLRLYPTYLDVPFPDSAIQSENGHHPFVPILVRLVDNAWWSGSQTLILIVGTLAAVGVLGAIAWATAKDRSVPGTTRAALFLLGTIAVFWLGNARILMHGNEQGHIYYTLLASALALLATQRAHRQRSGGWLALAGALCVCATFSFGNGLASFAGVLVLAVLLRLPARHIVLFGVLALATLYVYLYALPGDRSVRATLAFDPLTSASALTRWLSSPWLRSFLGAADPPLDASLAHALATTPAGRVLRWLAAAVAALFGADWVYREGLVLGALGLGAYVLAAVDAWRHRDALGRTRGFAIGLATFSLAAAAIVCLGRLSYFAAEPTQVLADRYSPWTCMFWLSLALYALTGPRSQRVGQRFAAIAATLAVVFLFAPSQPVYAGWCAAAHRVIQQAAVAAQLGILDPERNIDVGFTSPAKTMSTFATFRRHHVAMYAEPAYALIESGWKAPIDPPATLAGGVLHVTRRFEDAASGRKVAAVEGWLPKQPGLPRDPILVIVDQDGSVRGLAKISFDQSGKGPLRWRVARQRGFDGYVLDPKPGETLSLRVMRKKDRSPVGSVPLRIPPPPEID